MISTAKANRQVQEEQARKDVNTYLTQALGATFYSNSGQQRSKQWFFTIKCQREDIARHPVVGHISVDLVTGLVETLSSQKIQDIVEMAEVQAAHARGELARDENGFLLRLQARIKANAWVSNHVGMKVVAEGGSWVPTLPPCWRFSIGFQSENIHLEQLSVIDVQARSGQVVLLEQEQIQLIQEKISAAIQPKTLAAAA